MLTPSIRRSLLAVLLLPLPVLAGWTSAGAGSVSFKAQGPAGLKIDGVGQKLEILDDGTALQVSAPLDSLDTGIGLRNRHMLEDLEAAKYPTVTLTVPLAALKVPGAGETLAAEARGSLSLHGQSKELLFKYRATCTADACEIDGSADINVKDFGVKIRSYLGVTVKPDIRIGARLILKRPR